MFAGWWVGGGLARRGMGGWAGERCNGLCTGDAAEALAARLRPASPPPLPLCVVLPLSLPAPPPASAPGPCLPIPLCRVIPLPFTPHPAAPPPAPAPSLPAPAPSPPHLVLQHGRRRRRHPVEQQVARQQRVQAGGRRPEEEGGAAGAQAVSQRVKHRRGVGEGLRGETGTVGQAQVWRHRLRPGTASIGAFCFVGRCTATGAARGHAERRVAGTRIARRPKLPPNTAPPSPFPALRTPFLPPV